MKRINNNNILEFAKICNNLGILTFADLKSFIMENVPKGANIFECTKKYYEDLKALTMQERF